MEVRRDEETGQHRQAEVADVDGGGELPQRRQPHNRRCEQSPRQPANHAGVNMREQPQSQAGEIEHGALTQAIFLAAGADRQDVEESSATPL